MFYSQFILAKKGPLGTIWIAAHLERKLRKNQVADTDIGVSVDSILFPEMPIALRLSSHLLLGVVRIYSRKVNYLFDDCSEALLKVKQAFRSAAVDLPPEESTAPYHSITLPETFDLDDFELPDNDIFQGNYVDHHISSKDQITLQDTMEGVVYSTSKFGLDERFGDGDASGLDLDEELLVEKAATAEHATGTSYSIVDPQASVQANASLKYEENQDAPAVPEAMPASDVGNEIEEYDGDNELVEYAQAPCTPGLWEEPNLSNIQETSACDDHHEPENHSVTESVVKENLENIFSKEVECFPHEQQYNQFVPHNLDPTPFTESLLTDQVRHTSPKAEASDNIIGVDDNHENSVELQRMSDNITHVSSLTSSCQPVSEGFFDINQTTELESNAQPYGKENLDNLKDQACMEPSVLSGHYSMQSSDFPTFRPCMNHLNHSETSGVKHDDSLQPSAFTFLHPLETGREEHPSASGDSILVQGEGPHTTEELERNLAEIRLSKLGLNDELQVASNISTEQVDNVIDGEVQVDNINDNTSDLPAPEKLLYLPQGPSDVPKDLVLESTPAKEYTLRDGGDAGSDMLTGKKRSFTESSLTAQSLNLNESSSLFTTSITKESLLGDNDLLSSILVGRKSTILKMKPTPPREIPTTKRRRSAPKTPKTGISKRKVLMDDNMVLHGDIIRQQLMNTEDIRRLRKKAPCTKSEISMLEKQFWEDELFNEVIFTGVSIKLDSLHNHSYDLSKIMISQSEASLEGGTNLKSFSQNNENGMQLEIETQDNFDPLATKDVSETQPTEFPVNDNHPCDNNTTNSDYYGNQAQVHETRDVLEHLSSQNELLGMEIDAKTFTDADVGVSVMPIENEVQVEKISETDASLQMDAPVVRSDEKIDDMDPYMNTSINKSLESSLASEIKIDDDVSVREISRTEHDHTQISNVSTILLSSETDGLSPHIANLDQETEIRKNDKGFVNKDAELAPGVEFNAQNLVSNGICGEEFATVEAYDGNVNPVLEDVSLDDREYPGQQVTYPTNAANVEDIPAENRVDDDELAYSAFGNENDTDFLNFDDDDDDEAEAAGDYMPDVEATRFIDNSGWSSRTKAVAKYLQVMFDKEGERGRNMLPVNNLLFGKTRKEASRMFFETLVLKTKDYIHVEQSDPFENINILPRSKLLKSDF